MEKEDRISRLNTILKARADKRRQDLLWKEETKVLEEKRLNKVCFTKYCHDSDPFCINLENGEQVYYCAYHLGSFIESIEGQKITGTITFLSKDEKDFKDRRRRDLQEKKDRFLEMTKRIERLTAQKSSLHAESINKYLTPILKSTIKELFEFEDELYRGAGVDFLERWDWFKRVEKFIDIEKPVEVKEEN